MQQNPTTKKRDLLAELEEHIATCTQCQNSPYNPCPEGKAILVEVVENAKTVRIMRYSPKAELIK